MIYLDDKVLSQIFSEGDETETPEGEEDSEFEGIGEEEEGDEEPIEPIE